METLNITKGDWIVNRLSMNEDDYEILTSTPLAAKHHGAIAKVEISKYESTDQAEINAKAIASLPELIKDHEELKTAWAERSLHFTSLQMKNERLLSVNRELLEALQQSEILLRMFHQGISVDMQRVMDVGDKAIKLISKHNTI